LQSAKPLIEREQAARQVPPLALVRGAAQIA
jgi:hypothetical protein